MEARKKINMNCGWKFFKGDEPRASYRGFDDTDWRNVTVPHDWSVEYEFDESYASSTGYLCGGVAWYRKNFDIPFDLTGKRVYITFEGVYNNARLWCNTNHLGNRPNGYSTFTIDITDFVENKNNMISVRVDHSEVADSRWFTGSGIYRDVYLTITDEVHFDEYGVFVTTPLVDTQHGIVKADITVSNDAVQDQEVMVKAFIIDCESEAIEQKKYFIKAEESITKTLEIKLNSPRLWSPDDPFLYKLKAEIIKDEKIIDDFIVNFGVRTIRFDSNKGFFLNNQNMKIKGVCLHHDAGCLGAAVTEKVWKRRLKKLKKMGCNAIRTSHNPVATCFLDLCDKLGFLVQEEAFDEWEGIKNKWWQGHNVYPPKLFGYGKDFPTWCEEDIKSMVLRDRNHPSIIMWSIGNEIDYPNDPYCHPYFNIMEGNNDSNKPKQEMEYDANKPQANRLAVIARKLYKYVKQSDITRPVTAALAFPELSNLVGYSDQLDIVGYNYKEHLYEEHHKTYPDRVLYGSENGRDPKQWFVVRDNDYISGQFLWTGIDYLGEAKGWPVRVSGAGYLDTAGFEKNKFYGRMSLWTDETVLNITAKSLSEFNEEQLGEMVCDSAHWNWEENEKVQILCTTNCEEVELFLDDRSLGIKKLSDYPNHCMSWEVTYEPGIITAVGKTFDGKEYRSQLQTVSSPYKIKIVTEDLAIKADGQDIVQLEIYVHSKEDQLVPFAENEITLEIEGECEYLGMENGRLDDLTWYRSKTRNVHNGRLITFIRSTEIPDNIIVTATAKGLESDRIKIQAK